MKAREGYGSLIEVTRFMDKSIEVKDHGRGIPLTTITRARGQI